MGHPRFVDGEEYGVLLTSELTDLQQMPVEDASVQLIPGIAFKTTGHWALSCAPGSRRMRCRAAFVTR